MRPPFRPRAARAPLVFLLLLAGTAARAQEEAVANDYPTSARAEYVFTCMATNGNTRQSLERCSCSIDAIAGVVPYARYVQAETILRMGQSLGQRSEAVRNTGRFRDIVADLRRAQAEAEVQCFP